ncbi:MAG: SpoIIE family protein phosphatase [Ignavibacteria bacterium]|nr:SpoIIE family protein phosphatase [Ignavibacteria bacterium]
MKFISRFSDGTLRFLFTFIAIYCLAYSTIVFVNTMFTDRMTTDDCLWVNENDSPELKEGLRIVQVMDGGVTDVAGIRDGDVLIELDGLKFKNSKEAQDILNSYDSNQIVEYTIDRNGEIFKSNVRVYKVFNFLFLIFSLLGLGFILIGFMVGYSKPKELTSQLFFFLGCSASLGFNVIGINNYSVYNNSIFLNSLIGMSLFYPLLVHFFLTYPIKYEFRRRKLLISLLYIIVLLISLMNTFLPDLRREYEVLVYLNYFIIGGYFIAGITLFFVSYYRLEKDKQRKPLKVIFYGFLIGLAGFIYTSLIPVFVRKPNFLIDTWMYIPTILILAIPLSFGFSIIKYRILDTEFIIKKGLVFGIITAFIVGIYLLLVLFLDNLLSQFLPENKQLLTIALIIIVTFSFDFVNKKAKELVDKQFYRERYNYRKSLLLFSEELPYLNNIRQIIEKIAYSVKETMGIDNLHVWFLDDDYYKTLETEINAVNGSEKIFRNDSIYDDAFSSLYKLNKEPKFLSEVYLHELSIPEEYRKIIQKENFILSVPIYIKNKLIGAINFGEKPSGKAYSEEDIDLLKTLASQAAIAFENSRLQEEKISKQVIEEELHIARKIQMGLLPQKINSVNGIEISGFYNPAKIIGGDFYDVIKISETKILVVVADVSGKGIPAALYMSKVQAMIQFAATIFPSPKEMLIEVNKQIHQKIDKKSFITSVIAMFDLEKMTVNICRAGHNPVIYSVNGKFELLKNKGMGLGLESEILFNKNLEEVEIKIAPDNMFVFYSDGLTEAMNLSKEEFGTDKILDIIKFNRESKCSIIQDRIIASVDSFRNGAEQNDDITLVITKIVNK